MARPVWPTIIDDDASGLTGTIFNLAFFNEIKAYIQKALEFKDRTELTIATGVITITEVFHLVDTEGEIASDDLVTINGGTIGAILVIAPADDARTVVVKHNTGNIWLKSKVDLSLDDVQDALMLIYDGTKWMDLGSIDLTTVVLKSLFNANTILAADADDIPAALTIAEERLVGRITAGNIIGLTPTQIRTLINVENGATADQTGLQIVTLLEALADAARLDADAIEIADAGSIITATDVEEALQEIQTALDVAEAAIVTAQADIITAQAAADAAQNDIDGFPDELKNLPSADGIFPHRIGRATYDFAEHGGVQGAIGLGVTLPDNAIVVKAWYEVLTTLTSGTDAATIAIDIPTDDPAGIVATIDIADVGDPWDAGNHAAIQDGAVANFSEKLTAAREISITIGIENVTAGKFIVWCEYVVSD